MGRSGEGQGRGARRRRRRRHATGDPSGLYHEVQSLPRARLRQPSRRNQALEPRIARIKKKAGSGSAAQQHESQQKKERSPHLQVEASRTLGRKGLPYKGVLAPPCGCLPTKITPRIIRGWCSISSAAWASPPRRNFWKRSPTWYLPAPRPAPRWYCWRYLR